MATVRQVIYINKATDNFSASDLRELVESAARNNKKRDITGALLFTDGCFIQVIEGGERPMKELLSKLDSDPRHYDIRIISDHLDESRYFSDWSMGLVSAPEEEQSIVVGELHAVPDSDFSSQETDTIMPLPQTIAMMQRLYETDSVLQHARR